MQSTSVQSGQTPAAIYSPRPPLSTGVPGVASALLQGRQNGVVVICDFDFFCLVQHHYVSIVTYCCSAYKSKPCLYILVKCIVEREVYSDLALPLSTAAHTAIGAR